MAWRNLFGQPQVTSVEARQGFLDRPVLVVLTVSLALILMAFGLLGYFYT